MFAVEKWSTFYVKIDRNRGKRRTHAIIRQGDDLVKIVVDSLLTAAQSENIEFRDRDIVAATEAIVARAQGNYVSVDEIAEDIKAHFPEGPYWGDFPILSRNRFSICLKGIARGAKKITLMLSYPSDEVGNHLVSLDALDEKGINPYTDVLTEAQYRQAFGRVEHPFTGVDYIEYYKELIQGEGAEVEIILATTPKTFCPMPRTCWPAISIPGRAASGCCCKTVRTRRWAWMIL